jgi:hypothetical protein
MTGDEKNTQEAWFPHPANFSNSIPMKSARTELGMGIVTESYYWRAMEALRIEPSHKLPDDESTYLGFSDDWKIDVEQVEKVIKTFIKRKLFSTNGNGAFYSPEIMRAIEAMQNNIENKKRAGTLGAEKRWHKEESATPPVPQEQPKPRKTAGEPTYPLELQQLKMIHETKGLNFSMEHLIKVIWPNNNLTPDESVFTVIRQALKENKLTTVLIAIDKMVRYGEGKTKPSSYFKSILEEKKGKEDKDVK